MSWHPVSDARPRWRGAAPALAWPSRPEDFRVDEIPLYPASGEGEHLFVEIEKTGLSTGHLVERLAAALDLNPRDIGWAGRKDRHAVTRQRLSLPRSTEPRLAALEGDGFRILEMRAHGNKLRTGHLAGNRFELFLAGEASPETLSEALDLLSREGLPNYFGPQRFGARGDNHLQGRRLLERGKPRGRKQKLLANAWQSCLFNRVLDARVERLGELLRGDLAWIHAKGAVFSVEEPAAEAPRAAALEISPSGPLPGRRMSEPSGEPGEIEAALLAECGWDPAQGRGLRGARRPLRVPVAGLEAEAAEGGLRLRFSLPPGSFATVLLRELGLRPPR